MTTPKCDCPLTDAPSFLCPRYNHKMYPKSHAVCKGEHGEKIYNQYRPVWEFAGLEKTQAENYVEKLMSQPKKKVKWTYGITTVPSRREDLLPRTIESLRLAGFENPWLFVDGCSHEEAIELYERNDLFKGKIGGVTVRNPKVNAYGNWVMALWELYVRNPKSDYFSIFQDDFVTYKNLRHYLETLKYPLNGYWNLLTFPQNQSKAPKGMTGFFLSNQNGLGAVALVFSKKAVMEILGSEHMAGRPQNQKKGIKSIDGGVVTAMKKVGWKEYVHNPSLIQHTGETSVLGNRKHPLAPSFKGEWFDALDLLEKDEKTSQIANMERESAKIEVAKVRINGGLGDNVAKALKLVGITEKRVTKMLGRPCGCKERREKLNRLGAWARRIVTGKTENAKQHLDTILEDDSDADCDQSS